MNKELAEKLEAALANLDALKGSLLGIGGDITDLSDKIDILTVALANDSISVENKALLDDVVAKVADLKESAAALDALNVPA